MFATKVFRFMVVLAGSMLLFPATGAACITEYDGGPCIMPTPRPKPPKVPPAARLTAAQCPTCHTCENSASKVAEECADLDEQLNACKARIQAERSSLAVRDTSQAEAVTRTMGVVSQCRSEFQARIAMCEGVVSTCKGSCDLASTQVDIYLPVPQTSVQAANEKAVVDPSKQLCQRGEKSLAALKTADTTLAGQQSELLQILMLLGPAALEYLMSHLGNKDGGDLCAQLKNDYGEEHPTYKGACGPRVDLVDGDPSDPPESIRTDEFPGPKPPGHSTASGPGPHSQEFTGSGVHAGRKGSSAREQSVEPGGGGIMMGMDGSSSSGTTRYEGEADRRGRGYDTSILSDPDGGGAAGGGRRGAAVQRTPSQWVEGQGSSARAQAEAHRRKAEADAQRRRELRGPHAQGLFESVSEAYKRYRPEMMQ